MSKSLTSIALLFFLTGCSWIPFLGKKTTTDTNFSTYNGQELTINYPKDWEVITTFGSKYKDSKPLVGFRTKNNTSNFKTNLNIIKNTLNNPISSQEFATKKIEQHQQALSDYQELDKKNIELALDGKTKAKTILVLFTGKYETNGQTYKFMQTFLVKDKNAYTVTATMLPTEDANSVKIIATMLQSLALK